MDIEPQHAFPRQIHTREVLPDMRYTKMTCEGLLEGPREHFNGVLDVARFPCNGASRQKRTSWKAVPRTCHSRQAMRATRKFTVSFRLLREHHDFFLVLARAPRLFPGP